MKNYFIMDFRIIKSLFLNIARKSVRLFTPCLIICASAPAAYACCGVSEIVEYKTATAEYYKNGYPGFISRNGPIPNFYRNVVLYTNDVVDYEGTPLFSLQRTDEYQYPLAYSFMEHPPEWDRDHDLAPLVNNSTVVDASGYLSEYLTICGSPQWYNYTYSDSGGWTETTGAGWFWFFDSCFWENQPYFDSDPYVGDDPDITDSWFYENILDWYDYGCHDREISITLDDLYTTSELIDNCKNSMNWSGTSWQCGTPSSSTSLSGTEQRASCTMSKYRIRYIGPKGQPAKVEWTVRYTTPDGIEVAKEEHTQEVVCSGIEEIIGEFDLDPPYSNAVASVIVPGATTCNTGTCGPGKASIGLNDGIHIDYGMGSGYGFLYDRGNSGTLEQILGKFVSCGVASANYLDGNGNEYMQVVSPAVLADVYRPSGSSGYTVTFYSSWATKDGNGLYTTLLNPLYTYTIATTVSSGTYTYEIKSYTGGGVNAEPISTNTFQCANNVWTYVRPGNDTESSSWSALGADGRRTNTVTIRDSIGTVVSANTNSYLYLSDGSSLLVKTIAGSGNNSMTNLWYYDTTTTSPNYRKCIGKIDPNGYWERYYYDSNGRLEKIKSCYLNATYDAADNLCRTKEYSYDTIYSELDGGTVTPDVPRLVIEKIKGNIIRKHGTILAGRQRIEVEFASDTDQPFNASSPNLVTTNEEYAVTYPHNGLAIRVLNPDGTAEITKWETNLSTGEITCTVDVGAAYFHPAVFDPPQVIDGIRTITTTYNDLRDRTTTTKSYDLANPFYWLIDETCVHDSLGRPTITRNGLDATYTENSYTCCNLQYFRDREGMITYYDYDKATQRLKTITRAGITTSNAYDAAGNIIGVYRFPNTTPATPIRLEGNAYDLAGRRIRTTNAVGGITYYSSGFLPGGYRRTWTTFPDQKQSTVMWYRDGQRYNITGAAVADWMLYTYNVELHPGTSSQYDYVTLEAHYNNTNQWIKHYQDWLSREYKTVYSSAPGQQNPTAESYYNAFGQLKMQSDVDGKVTLYGYNARGELQDTAIRMDPNTSEDIDYSASGHDRITRTINSIARKDWYDVRRTTTYQWDDGQANPIEILVRDTAINSPNVDRTWETAYGLTTKTEITYDTSIRKRTVKVIKPDNSFTESVYQDGKLMSVKNYDSSTSPQFISGFDYAYEDGHGRQTKRTDSETGSYTRFEYDNLDRITSSTVVDYAPNQEGEWIIDQTTTRTYNSAELLQNISYPDGTYTTYSYYDTRLLRSSGGTHEYSQTFDYDSQGRLLHLNGNTTWKYDTYTGFMTNKVYADGKGTSYSYKPSGKIQTRSWARANQSGAKVTATYSYNKAGDVQTITYNDGLTPNIEYTYDRRGRLQTVSSTVDSSTTTETLSYNNAGMLEGETFGSMTVATTYNSDTLWRETLALKQGNTTHFTQTFTPDSASRLKTASSGTITHTYVYNPIDSGPWTSLIRDITCVDGAVGPDTIHRDRSYDMLDRLVYIGTGDNGYSYEYDNANRPTRVADNNNIYWLYDYDSFGQVTSGKRHWWWPINKVIPGQQYEYGYDWIGNRTFSRSGGDEWGTGLRETTYYGNSLNQYSSRRLPEQVDIIGAAKPEATITVNLEKTYRYNEYYRAELDVPNQAGPVYLAVTNLGVVSSGTSPDITNYSLGHLFIPQSPEVFTYDADGNLTHDGRWNYTWDAENRLIGMESYLPSTVAPKVKFGYRYDYKGRRVGITNYVWMNENWQGTEYKCVYDDWNLIAVLDFDNTPLYSFLWGTDASGTLQGVGGVGGLLSMTIYAGPNAGNYYYAYDGNNNVTRLASTSSANPKATQYEYGPFGELIRATGPLAHINPFRFSTKYQDDGTGLLYYGYRYFNPTTGRWLSRDPLGEKGGLNLYGFVRNQPSSAYDKLGLSFTDAHDCNSQQINTLRQAEVDAFRAVMHSYDLLSKEFEGSKVAAGNDDFYALYSSVFPEAEGMNILLAAVNENHFRRNYDNWRNELMKVFLRTFEGFSKEYEVECECECTGSYADDYAYYYKLSNPFNGKQFYAYKTIHFCPTFFKRNPSGQAETYFHEMSHLYADTNEEKIQTYTAEDAKRAYTIDKFLDKSNIEAYIKQFTDKYRTIDAKQRKHNP